MGDINKTQRLFELANEIERLKSEMKKYNEELSQVLQDLGVGTYHQDPMDGTVYKVVEPSGTFIQFHKISYERTAKVGEAKGSLSKKEAHEQGFEVLGNLK